MAKKKKNNNETPDSPGKFLIALGGLLGFGLTFAVSFMTGGDVVRAFLFGAIACVLCAFVMKLFAIYIEKHIDAILNAKADEIRRQREREQAESFEEEAITDTQDTDPA